jgi:hypothetical protein
VKQWKASRLTTQHAHPVLSVPELTSSAPLSPSPLFVIHCDVCGPLPTCYGGYSYFISFIDCKGRYVSIFFMHSRDEALDHFIQFRTYAERFTGERIMIIRIDNAPELVRGRFEAYCKTEGIIYEKTVPDSPSQNGVAERLNLTLACMGRAMLIDADLSDWFWPFAIQCAVHIKNRLPHKALPPATTPFFFWNKHKPNVAHFRIFGSYCTARILSTNLTKFQPRGESGRFLGYAKDAKGYLIWIPGRDGKGGSVKTRRDVIFHDFPPTVPVPQSHDNLSPLWEDVAFPEYLVKPYVFYHNASVEFCIH